MEIDPSLIQPPVDGITRIVVSNPAGISCHLEKGCVLGEGSDAALVEPVGLEEDPPAFTRLIQSQLTVDQRQRCLEAVFGETGSLDQEQCQLLMSLLATHHTAFCLEEHERGETNLVEMEILKGDAESRVNQCKIGDWVLVWFPQEETGKLRKLSRPWHGPYRVIERSDPDLTVVKVYAPDDRPI